MGCYTIFIIKSHLSSCVYVSLVDSVVFYTNSLFGGVTVVLTDDFVDSKRCCVASVILLNAVDLGIEAGRLFPEGAVFTVVCLVLGELGVRVTSEGSLVAVNLTLLAW